MPIKCHSFAETIAQTPAGPPAEISAFYGRVSTNKQEISLDTQDERVAAYAMAKKLSLLEELKFTDEDTSGSIPLSKRKGGRKLLETIEDRVRTAEPVRHLIVTKIDRLGRDSLDGEIVMRKLRELGVIVHIIDLGGDSLSTAGFFGELVIKMIFAIAEWDRRNITQNIRTMMKVKRDRGELCGALPYGWNAEPTGQVNPKTGREIRRLVDNLSEQGWILQMKEWRDNGAGYHIIARQLNDLKVPTKIQGTTKQIWTSSRVRKILMSKQTQAFLARRRAA